MYAAEFGVPWGCRLALFDSTDDLRNCVSCAVCSLPGSNSLPQTCSPGPASGPQVDESKVVRQSAGHRRTEVYHCSAAARGGNSETLVECSVRTLIQSASGASVMIITNGIYRAD